MRKWLILVVAAVLLVLPVTFLAVKRLKAWLPGYVRERAISTLRSDFAGEVEFGDLAVSIFPQIVIQGDGLVVRQPGRSGVPPLIRVKRFWMEAGAWELLRGRRHVRKITLEGLIIVAPPRRDRPVETPRSAAPKKTRPPFRVRVDEIVADNAELDVLLKDPAKLPRVFHIRHLRLQNAGLGQAMTYHATLSNPLPAGEIESRGKVGPWQADDPRLTPLAGTYTFTHADLASFRGLGGILSSQGQFQGRLDHIDVQGETSTPNFSLGISGHPVPLETQFHAIVDGATGDTLLDNVRAKLQDSVITARGGIFRVPGQKYRRVSLDAVSRNGKLEDFLRLALKAKEPPMTGVIGFQTRIEIPPEAGVIADRLRLDGQFDINSARFSQLNIQQKVAALSRRARGPTADDTTGSVVSNFAGKFLLQNAVMTFSKLTFGVPGASVHLDGTYALRGEAIDFHGTLGLQATLSQLTHGWKSKLLKPIDPLFEKQGAGTLLPIKITGTGSDPKFAVDVRHIF